MSAYKTVANYSEQVEIKRSQFITHVYHVADEDEVFARLNELRKKYSDATHVCYAAIMDTVGNAARFSDDGEPSGTAGAPILDAIKKSELKQVLVAVVRYFGGIKLGGGGLVRAYSSCASSALKNAPQVTRTLCDVYELSTDFSKAKKLAPHLPRLNIKLLNTQYTDKVTFTIAVTSGVEISAALAEVLNEQPNLVNIETRYIEEN